MYIRDSNQGVHGQHVQGVVVGEGALLVHPVPQGLVVDDVVAADKPRQVEGLRGGVQGHGALAVSYTHLFNFIVPDMLTNDDPKVRATAAEALGNMDNEHASAHLRYYLEREKDPTVIAAMRNAIAALNKGE